MSISLSEIKKFLKSDLETYNSTFKTVMASNVMIVDNVAKYIVKYKGKGLRPLLVLLSARLCGTPNANTYKVAAVVELLHTATLIHDDVVDNAGVRRGFPSINALWKNKISVLMGDYLLSKSLISATETDSLEIMRILADTARRLSKGELFQIEKSRKLDITEKEYFKLVSDKTAALISTCCALGALTVSDDHDRQKAMSRYGENLGIAFQIKDDLLDYEGKQSVVGKPVGADLKEKKITLPLILSFEKAPEKERRFIIKLLKKTVDKHEVRRIIDFSVQYGGVEAARKRALEYAQKAKNELSLFPDGQTRSVAESFVDYITNRNK